MTTGHNPAFSLKEAAEYASCSVESIRRLIQNHHLPAWRHKLTEEPEPGKTDRRKQLVLKSDLDAYLLDCRNNNAA